MKSKKKSVLKLDKGKIPHPLLVFVVLFLMFTPLAFFYLYYRKSLGAQINNEIKPETTALVSPVTDTVDFQMRKVDSLEGLAAITALGTYIGFVRVAKDSSNSNLPSIYFVNNSTKQWIVTQSE